MAPSNKNDRTESPNSSDESKTPTTAEKAETAAHLLTEDEPATSTESVDERPEGTAPVDTRPVPLSEQDQPLVNEGAVKDQSLTAMLKAHDEAHKPKTGEGKASNIDDKGMIVPGVTKDGEPIYSPGVRDLIAPEPGTVVEPEAQALRTLTPVTDDETAKRAATLSDAGALAYLRVRGPEDGQTAVVESGDSFARAEREGNAVRVKWTEGEASNMAAYEAHQMATLKANQDGGRLDRLHAQITDADQDLEDFIASIEAKPENGDPKQTETAIKAAQTAHASQVAGLRKSIADEEARAKIHADLPTGDLRSGEVLLALTGKVVLTLR